MRNIILALGAIALSLSATFAMSQTAEHPNFPVVVLDRQEGIIAIVGRIDF